VLVDEIIGHTAFINFSGYANHARNFFTELNKLIPTRIRNFSHTPDISHLTAEQRDMIIEQSWKVPPWKIGTPWMRIPGKKYLNIILMESHHYYYYDSYDDPTIAYNVWESTRQLPQFFNRLLDFNQLWVPSEWQKEVTIEQGYPEDKIKVVHEGIDGSLFYPDSVDTPPSEYQNDKFKFIYFGRWDYRKSTTECIRAFLNEFKKDEPVELILSADNSYPVDGYSSTEERLHKYNLDDPRIQIIHFPPFTEYIKYLRLGNVFLSCARSEGWNLPLCEAMACGIPTICSNYGAQLEFAKDISHLVDIKGMKDAQQIYHLSECPGQFAEPDFEHLQHVMRDVYENYDVYKDKALRDSYKIRSDFSWKKAAKKAYELIDQLDVHTWSTNPKEAIKTSWMIDEKKPKVIIDSREKLGRCFCNIKDLKSGTSIYATNFDLQKGSSVWMAPGVSPKEVSGLIIEITDENGKLIHKNSVKYDNDVDYKESEFVYKKPEKRDNWFKNYHEDVRKLDGRIDLYEKDDFKGSTVLDIGCNSGQISFQARKWGAKEVTGIDYDKAAIDTAMKNNNDLDVFFYVDDIDNPLFWSSIPDYDVVLYLSIIGTPELENPYGGLSKACMKTNKVMYFEGHGLHEYSEYMNFLLKFTDFSEIVYKGVVQNNDRPFIRCSRKIYNMDEALLKLVDVSKRHNKIAIVGKPHVGKTYMRKKIQDMPEFKDFVIVDDLGEVSENNDGYNSLGDEYIKPFGDNRYPEWPFISEDQRKKVNEYDKIIMFDYRSLMHIENFDVVFNMITDMKSSHFENYKNNYTLYYRNPPFVNTENIKEFYTVYNEVNEISVEPQPHIELESQPHIEPIDIQEIPNTNNIQFNVHFIDGPFLEIKMNESDNEDYDVYFIDNDIGEVIFKTKIKPNMWTRSNRKYYTNWRIEVRKNDNLIFEHNMDLYDKRVLITIDSKSIGDNIAWMPYVEEFRKKWNCNVILSTFFNHLFETEYPHIQFISPGNVVRNIYAQYLIGCFDNDYDRNKNNWRLIPLQQVSSDILGLEYKEIKTRVTRGGISSSVKEFTAFDLSTQKNKKINMSLPEFWTKIYNENMLEWRGEESKSGEGSEKDNADTKINLIKSIIEENQISSILDLGCGDIYWMQKILDNFQGNYLGIDVAQDVVDENIKKYESHKNIEFDCLDITSEGGQKAFRKRYGDRNFDMIIGLDILGHLLNDEVDLFVNFICSINPELVFLTNRESKEGRLYLTGPKTRSEGIDINYHPVFKENFEILDKYDHGSIPDDKFNLYKFIGNSEDFKKPSSALGKYVTISEHSTLRCKYWNYLGGWQTVVDYLNENGYKVIVVSKENTKLKNVIARTGRILRETLATIRDSDFFIGVSSGPAWLAWALDVPVILISGCTERWNEFSDAIRIINEDVCHGCINDSRYPFDRGNWNWCPKNKSFECTRSISPEIVIREIDKLIEKIS